ncbi:hypothetical protein EAS54_15045 [Bradyrhizobium guangzhouense]|nr:hypothetical protein EAS54_15045 [Bradyrhizobium guangzhouense]
MTIVEAARGLNSHHHGSRGLPPPTVHGVVFAVLAQPRPTNGIFVAITVMVSTLASSGRPAM